MESDPPVLGGDVIGGAPVDVGLPVPRQVVIEGGGVVGTPESHVRPRTCPVLWSIHDVTHPGI